jgi:hypothetical protein
MFAFLIRIKGCRYPCNIEWGLEYCTGRILERGSAHIFKVVLVNSKKLDDIYVLSDLFIT